MIEKAEFFLASLYYVHEPMRSASAFILLSFHLLAQWPSQIALQAHVSSATVSRILNREDSLS
ncbi:LacI family DNA-binding transcriptional regulator [Bacillus sp. ISL-51]|nr:LacI family DNA-binding transcriptional regulator [Bacillus sp. ISL-51]MBT2636297.1 LacI family DNA-binding transcriptional regulator [Bacillus sp. ISL-26]